ncbi:MAG TPA: histidine kinase [Solirubrobacteraceae bacterium]
MRALARALVMLALLGLLLGLIGIAVIVTSGHATDRGLEAALVPAIGWSWIYTGLYAWWRRPDNRVGALMTLIGLLFLLTALAAADPPGVFTVAILLGSLYFAAAAHLLLAYPDGRLDGPGQARFVVAVYALAVFAPLTSLLFGWGRHAGDCNCPRSVLLVSDSPGLADALDVLTSAAAVGMLAYVIVVVVRRWRAATPPQRRAMGPVLWSGAALMVLLAGQLTSQAVGLPNAVTGVLSLLGLMLFASVPFAFLFGLLRTRFSRAGTMNELLPRLAEAPGTGGLRELLADALGDRSLQLVYWIEGRSTWVDREGHPAALPDPDDPTRAWTSVELEGRRVGAIVHDATLCDDPDAMRSVAAAAGFAVENERLQAELRARVEDLRASRARLVEAGLLERRRLERNLHDGAQQRLVALSLTLRMAEAKVRADPERAEGLMDEAQHELTTALAELRELARGIHPAVLSDRGLGPALEALAGRSPVPVRLAEVPHERLPAAIEAAAYYVVAEALTNVVKYADASEATVAVRRDNGAAVVEVRDDGVGGADPGRGSGLQGLADRVASLDGSLVLDSPAGSGTRLRAEIPV